MKYIILLFFTTSHTHLLHLENVYIAVKTTQQFENTRLPIVLDTWFTYAKKQIWFFTDVGDSSEFSHLQNITNDHIIVTNCGKSHGRSDLCCKTGNMLDLNLTHHAKLRWLCLFDDDTYVNVPKLVEELEKYKYQKYKYLGRKYFEYITAPPKHSSVNVSEDGRNITYYYGHIGAGVCISRALLLEMQSYLRDTCNNSFVQLCNKIKQPDDVAVGYLIDKVGATLINVPRFHSHLDPLNKLQEAELKNQISVGYNLNLRSFVTITVPGFHNRRDPTRFYSLHCFLGYCSKKLKNLFKVKLAENLRKSYLESRMHIAPVRRVTINFLNFTKSRRSRPQLL